MSRRDALRSAGLLGIAATATRVRADDQGQAEEYVPALGMPEGRATEVVRPDTLLTHLTEDKLVATVQFGQDLDALTLDLAGTKASSLTKVASVEVPVKVPPTADDEARTFFGYLAVIRGYNFKDKGARVVVMLDLGGKVHVREDPFGEEREDTSLEQRYFSFPASDSETGYVPAPPYFTAVLTVSVQRRSPDAQARFAIQELDVSIVQPKR